KDALDAMGDSGILNVFAAGNAATNVETAPYFPVSYTSPSVLGVAASTSSDERAGFSNFGAVSIDLAAPGSGVLSTTSISNSSYGVFSGTSMATPHAAGAAALLSAHNPALSAASLKATLMNTVDPLPAWNGVVKTGGRLNVDRALRNQTTCTFTPEAMTIAAPTKGGTFSVNVTSAPNCDFSVKSNVNWIKVGTAEAMNGTGGVTFFVKVNPTIRRTGTVTVAGQTLTITQSRQG
ncbi:MAG TPA: S8 family serine peptidase, partial [Pyrinomonadaceae bacterium]|nr:S8 family serine peptidase [Pyrinomonadaceae bacterium]